jgi:hypothetical protein
MQRTPSRNQSCLRQEFKLIRFTLCFGQYLETVYTAFRASSRYYAVTHTLSATGVPAHIGGL